MTRKSFIVICYDCGLEFERFRRRLSDDGKLRCKKCSANKGYKRYSGTDKKKACQKRYRNSDKGKLHYKEIVTKSESFRKAQRNYQNKAYNENTNYKLCKTLRNRLRDVLKNDRKLGLAVRNLGCTIEELKRHLEDQFQEGMTWDNWGEWHIDHIIPLSSFDLSDREQLLKACHYTNLQPLWAKYNILKSNSKDEG